MLNYKSICNVDICLLLCYFTFKLSIFVLFFFVWFQWFNMLVCQVYYSSMSSSGVSIIFSFGSLMLLLSGMLLTVSFCPLLTVIFVWLLLFLVFCCVLSCGVSLVLFPSEHYLLFIVGVCFFFAVSCFQIVLECLLQDLSFCVCLSDPRGIAELWFVSSLHACCFCWPIVLSLLYILCMICCCSYGLPFLLQYHGSMVYHLLIEPLQWTLLE